MKLIEKKGGELLFHICSTRGWFDGAGDTSSPTFARLLFAGLALLLVFLCLIMSNIWHLYTDRCCTLTLMLHWTIILGGFPCTTSQSSGSDPIHVRILLGSDDSTTAIPTACQNKCRFRPDLSHSLTLSLCLAISHSWANKQCS